MSLRLLIAAAGVPCTLVLMTSVCLAAPRAPASLSSQAITQDLRFHYPVRPSEIALFGELGPPSSAKALSRACLRKGSWAMFWVPALSHVQLRLEETTKPSKLALLKISGPPSLQGILAFVEHPLNGHKGDVQDIFNADTTRRAFLVSSSTPVCLRVQGRSSRSPDLAWTKAWRSDWRTQDPFKAPLARWFDQNITHPDRVRRVSQARALQELTKDFPASLPYSRWLAALDRLSLAMERKPGRLAKFRREHLHSTWDPRQKPAPDFSDPAEPFRVVAPGRPVNITVKGPGTFELRARVTAPAHFPSLASSPEIILDSPTRRIVDLALLQPRANQPIPSLGPVAKKRFWLPKGTHRLTLRARAAPVRLSLRQDLAAPRLAAVMAHATPARAQRKASVELEKLENVEPKLAKSLAHLLSPWQAAMPLPKPSLRGHDHLCSASRPFLCAYSALSLAQHRRIAATELQQRLLGACQRLSTLDLSSLQQTAQQQTLANLATALATLGEAQSAAQCLGHTTEVTSAAYLKASLKLQAPEPTQEHDPWLSTGMTWFKQRDSPLALKSAYLRRKKSRTRRRSIPPDASAKQKALAWLVAQPTMPVASSGKKAWHQLTPKQSYTLAPTPGPRNSGRVMRLLIAPQHYPTQIKVRLGDQVHEVSVDDRPQVFHWIISPAQHEVQVLAPKGTQILCDQPLDASLSALAPRFAQRRYWEQTRESEPLKFETGPQATLASIKLRVQVSNRPEHRQTLPLTLRQSHGPPVGLWLHYDPTTIDPSLHFGDFPRSSYPIDVELGLVPPGAKLWLVPRNHAPRLAASVQASQLRMPEPMLVGPTILTESPKSLPTSQAQGPYSLKERIARASALLDLQEFGQMRNELAWIAKTSDHQLKTRSQALAALLHKIALRWRTSDFVFTAPEDSVHRSPEPRALRARFLDEPASQTALSAPEIVAQLHQSAMSLRLDNETSIIAALDSISRYLSPRNEAQTSPENDALVYGMLEQITQRIQGRVLTAWKGTVARKTRWKNIEYASQSNGHEWLQSTAQDEAEQGTALVLQEHQNKVLHLVRNEPGELKVQSQCHATGPEKQRGPTTLTIKINRSEHHEIEMTGDRPAHKIVPLIAGKTRISLSTLHQQDRRCLLDLLERPRPGTQWTPVELERKQRWFVASHANPVSFYAKGPGTLKIHIRSLSPEKTTSPLTINAKGPQATTFSIQVTPDPGKDPNAHLVRDKAQPATKPRELSLLMAHPGVYRYQFLSSGPQYLIRGSTRMPAENRPAKGRFAGILGALKQRLARQNTSSPAINAAPFPTHALPTPTITQRERPSRLGIWELQAGAGLLSDMEYDDANPRWSTQVHGAWLGVLLPKRLWLKNQLSIGSENRIVPATRARTRLYFSSSRAWLRGHLQLQVAGQYLHRMAYRFGMSGKLEFSLRSLRGRGSNWDLLTDLRFAYRGLSKNTRSIAETSLQDALHRYVYRSYLRDHPFSLRPRLQLVWRKFYDIRAHLGQDLWLNADLTSIDRTRAWLKVSGLIDPFFARRRVNWSYDTGYRLSIVPADAHRSQSFVRNEFMLDLKAAFRFAPQQLWQITASSAILSQSQQAPSFRVMLTAGVAFDKAGPLMHRPIQTRRYPSELKTKAWNDPEATP